MASCENPVLEFLLRIEIPPQMDRQSTLNLVNSYLGGLDQGLRAFGGPGLKATKTND